MPRWNESGRGRNELVACLSDMVAVSRELKNISSSISIHTAKAAPAMTKMPAPGRDSVSTLVARFFNAHGSLYRTHTDRGAVIGRRFSSSLKDAADKYNQTEVDNNEVLRSSWNH